MKNSVLLKFLVGIMFAIVLVLANGYSAASKKDEKYQFIRWKPVPGVRFYRIEIADETGKIWRKKNIAATQYASKTLPQGKYRCRVAPLDVFRKPMVWSKWQKLEVRVAKRPRIRKSKPIAIRKKKSFQLVTIRGNNFSKNTRVRIVAGRKKIPIRKTKVLTSKKLRITLDLRKVEPGNYDLVLQNPLKKKVRRKRFIRILDKTDSGKNTQNRLANRNQQETASRKNGASQREKAIASGKGSKNQSNANKQKQQNASANKNTKKESTNRTADGNELQKAAQYTDMNLASYLKYVKSLDKNCSISNLPDKLIRRCSQNHILLQQGDKAQQDLYNFLRIRGKNYFSRIAGYKYFYRNCKPVMYAAREYLQKKLRQRKSQLDGTEKAYIQRTLYKFRKCH
ncbi:MAG: hypothetical protein AAF518_08770 [Spirochaetota bacterium]